MELGNYVILFKHLLHQNEDCFLIRSYNHEKNIYRNFLDFSTISVHRKWKKNRLLALKGGSMRCLMRSRTTFKPTVSSPLGEQNTHRGKKILLWEYITVTRFLLYLGYQCAANLQPIYQARTFLPESLKYVRTPPLWLVCLLWEFSSSDWSNLSSMFYIFTQSDWNNFRWLATTLGEFNSHGKHCSILRKPT